MKISGYVTIEGNNVLHRGLACPSLIRSENIADGSVWALTDGSFTRTLKDKTPWTLCQVAACVPIPEISFETAACVGCPHDWFFPEGQSPNYDNARLVCGECSMREACLDYAIKGNMEFGMFGGLSPADRRRLHRKNYKREYRADGKQKKESDRVFATI